MLSNASLWAIAAYQNWISPYKGFRCAYSVLHGGTGCSGYAKGQIKTLGLFRALPKIRARFQACRAAMETLQREPTKSKQSTRQTTGNQRNKKGRYDCQRCGTDAACTSCDCIPFARSCRGPADATDCNTCDVCSCG